MTGKRGKKIRRKPVSRSARVSLKNEEANYIFYRLRDMTSIHAQKVMKKLASKFPNIQRMMEADRT